MADLILWQDTDGAGMALLFQPLSRPAQLYRTENMKLLIEPCMTKGLKFVNGNFFCLY